MYFTNISCLKTKKIKFDPNISPPTQKEIDTWRHKSSLLELIGLILLLCIVGSMIPFMDVSYILKGYELTLFNILYLFCIVILSIIGLNLINNGTSDYNAISPKELEKIKEIFSRNKILENYLKQIIEQKRLPVKFELNGAIVYSFLEKDT